MVSKEELYILCCASVLKYPFFSSLRIALINDSKAVRAAGIRIIRLCLKNEEYAHKLVQADLHYFIAKYYKE
jgi:hypothetical protein